MVNEIFPAIFGLIGPKRGAAPPSVLQYRDPRTSPPLGKGDIEISMEFSPLAKIATNPAGVNPVGRLLNSGW